MTGNQDRIHISAYLFFEARALPLPSILGMRARVPLAGARESRLFFVQMAPHTFDDRAKPFPKWLHQGNNTLPIEGPRPTTTDQTLQG